MKTRHTAVAAAALGIATLLGITQNAQAQDWGGLFSFGDGVSITGEGGDTAKRRAPRPDNETSASIRRSYLKAGKPFVRHKDDKGKISVSFPSGFGNIAGALDVMGETWGAGEAAKFDAAMKAKGVHIGSPLMLRVYKISDKGDTGHVEMWMKPDGQDEYVHVVDMPMCMFSGQLGPKTAQGDLQMPEGFFVITPNSPRGSPTYTWSVDVGFNSGHTYVKRHGYSGSAIMIHGKCRSVGCAALADTYIHWVRRAINGAIKAGQERIHVQMFPFAMTEANLKAHASHPYARFWREELKPAYDRFAQTRIPEDVAVCGTGKKARYTLRGDVVAGRSCETVDGQTLEPAETVVARKAVPVERIIEAEPVHVEPVLSKFVIDGRVLTMDEFGQFKRCADGSVAAGETCAIDPKKIFACVSETEGVKSYSLWTEQRVSMSARCWRVESANLQFK